MRLGWTVSGIGHAALFLVLLFGGLFRGDRIPEAISVSDVAIISEEEFAALTVPGAAPETQTDAPDVTPPAESDTAPDAPAEESAPSRPEPSEVEQPETPEEPDIAVPAPLPDAVVVDQSPPVPVAPSEQDGTSLERDAVAAPAPRVVTAQRRSRVQQTPSPHSEGHQIFRSDRTLAESKYLPNP